MTPAVAAANEALDYQAPFLIEKLVKQGLAQTDEEAAALFAEVKKYIILAQSDNDKLWHMFSLRVDEAWHQFILYTAQYTDFCQRFFHRYIHHSPSNAPKSEVEDSRETPTFDAFRKRYEELFGVPLPDVWYDERSVIPQRRIFSDRAGLLTLRSQDDMVELLAPNGEVLFRVNELATDALAFLTQTPAFYVRELPGGLTDDEKVALVSTLVEYKILRVG